MDLLYTAKSFGCHDLVLIGEKPSPKTLEYLDLWKIPDDVPKVDAVAEFQSRPLLYIVSEGRMTARDTDPIPALQNLLANRGERAFIGVISPGALNVYPVNWSILAKGSRRTILKESPEAPFFFPSLADGSFTMEGVPESSDYVYKAIFDLMSKSSAELIKTHGIDPMDTLSFLGRALFFRFLWDRNIVRKIDLPVVCHSARSLGDCFGNAANCAETCRWLDDTFNGDLLPLSGNYGDVFEKAGKQTKDKLFLHLRAILEGWEHAGKGYFQTLIDWGDLDFAHIPIGVLSQVYENFSREWDPQSHDTSVYYTPKNIARHLVDEAFEGLPDMKDAKVLDPSCGAGIFLVLAFRKLFAARWDRDGKRPDTQTIQSMLYGQIRGFDVSESALRLAALSLYITAIELNGSPRPPKSLKFPEPLQGIVLHNQRKPEEKDTAGFVLGSLRPDLPEGFHGFFDLVIGNPPWSRLRGENKKEDKRLNTAFTTLTREILNHRGLEVMAKNYHNPDNNPDLPFLWKATQWAKSDGIITMVLPGRIFLKRTDSGSEAFQALLNGLEITGILNGSNLSDTDVWPGMNQPFMLLFARNRVPSADHHFYFVTPHYERILNDQGRIRIDYQSAQPVAITEILKKPWILKSLSMGTPLDVEVIQTINESGWPTIKSYWDSHGLYTGRGYDLSPNSEQSDASFLKDLPDFKRPTGHAFSVDLSEFPIFNRPTAHMPRNSRLYQPPILIVPEAPGGDITTPKSWILRNPAVFSSSYYGFSAHHSKDPIAVISFLHLITYSELFRYHVLISSSKIGAERRAFLKNDMESFSIPPFEMLSDVQRNKAISLSDQLEHASVKPWKEINDFIYDVYGLNTYDRQVVRDTLDVAAPFRESRDRANNPPTAQERRVFCNELTRLLSPSFEITRETVQIEAVDLRIKDNKVSPWYFLSIRSSKTQGNLDSDPYPSLIGQIIEQANTSGSSRVIVHGHRHLLMGIIGQYRYWTLSRARLAALDILRHHLDVFPVGSADA